MGVLGGKFFKGSSRLYSQPLGVIQVGFDGYDAGKTTADATLTPDKDEKDILFQQDGTKGSDSVRTGQEYVVAVTFGEISTGLVAQMMAGVSTKNTDPNKDSGIFGRSIYQSMREQEAKPLRIVAVDENGAPSEDIEDQMNFYEAIPMVTGELINWGADTQRNLPMEFKIKFHEFADGESSVEYGAFGYWGDPTTEDVPATAWLDKSGPEFVSAVATITTNMDITFGVNIAFQGAFDAEDYSIKVNDKFVVPTAGAISSAVLSLTFAAATFTAGDVVSLSIGGAALEDTESTPTSYSGVNDSVVTNSVV